MTTKFPKTNWKIGELAAETGLTVRALHHYDQIGLLKPSSESDGGHRVYNTTDVERLQKIVTLKQLGFSLDRIKDTMPSPASLSARRRRSCAPKSRNVKRIWKISIRGLRTSKSFSPATMFTRIKFFLCSPA